MELISSFNMKKIEAPEVHLNDTFVIPMIEAVVSVILIRKELNYNMKSTIDPVFDKLTFSLCSDESKPPLLLLSSKEIELLTDID